MRNIVRDFCALKHHYIFELYSPIVYNIEVRKNPLVTVLMPAFNSERFLRQSIESILSQTYKNFEFIIINDGSTDNSAAILRQYKDKRIRFINRKVNLGLDANLNYGFKIAKGKYIARMDSDDISLPTRLEKQVAFLEKNPLYGLLGTQYANISETGEIIEISGQLLSDQEIKFAISSMNTFCHPTVMFRTSVIRKHGMQYDHAFYPYEDYELWTRIVKKTKVANLDEVLLFYRLNSTGMSLSDPKRMFGGANKFSNMQRKSQKDLPTITLPFLYEIIKGKNKYSKSKTILNQKKYNTNLMLGYQTYLYKVGTLMISKKKFGGIALLITSFFFNPGNWFKKLLSNRDLTQPNI